MTDTVFGKILDGEIPCYRVYEDEHVLAFLDIGPLSRGHTLLIPKQRVAGVHELDPAHGAAIGRVLPALCRAVMQATGASDYNVLCNTGGAAGQEVPHVHFHIIPKTDDGGLRMEWRAGSLGEEDAVALVSAITSALA